MFVNDEFDDAIDNAIDDANDDDAIEKSNSLKNSNSLKGSNSLNDDVSCVRVLCVRIFRKITSKSNEIKPVFFHVNLMLNDLNV